MGGNGETLERPLICTFNKRAQYRYSYYHYNNSIIRHVGSQSDAEQLLHALITSTTVVIRHVCHGSAVRQEVDPNPGLNLKQQFLKSEHTAQKTRD